VYGFIPFCLLWIKFSATSKVTGMTALGDDRRYFSYYKALSVLEKVPFKITSVDQIKGLPTIGKSLMENVSTLSLGLMTFSSLCLSWSFGGLGKGEKSTLIGGK
jgi:hypothetical protein